MLTDADDVIPRPSEPLPAPSSPPPPPFTPRAQCQAPKRRFNKFNVSTGVQEGGSVDVATVATVVGGLVGVAVLAFIGLSL